MVFMPDFMQTRFKSATSTSSTLLPRSPETYAPVVGSIVAPEPFFESFQPSPAGLPPVSPSYCSVQ